VGNVGVKLPRFVGIEILGFWGFGGKNAKTRAYVRATGIATVMTDVIGGLGMSHFESVPSASTVTFVEGFCHAVAND
jgi:hypothetical protein